VPRLIVPVLALLLASCASSSAAQPSTGTVTGKVTAGPTCPVERAGHPCPPAPVSAQVVARRRGFSASTHTDAHGRYTLHLPAGTYSLAAVTKQQLPRCTPRNVTVHANAVTRAPITCDTGIR
jgi:hypothetical protein